MDKTKNFLIVESKINYLGQSRYQHDVYELCSDTGLYKLMANDSSRCGESLDHQLDTINLYYFAKTTKIVRISEVQWLYIQVAEGDDAELAVVGQLQLIRV